MHCIVQPAAQTFADPLRITTQHPIHAGTEITQRAMPFVGCACHGFLHGIDSRPALLIAAALAGCSSRPANVEPIQTAAEAVPVLECPAQRPGVVRHPVPRARQYVPVTPLADGSFVLESMAFNPIKNKARANKTAEGECLKRYRRWETLKMEDRGGWIRLHFRCGCPLTGYEGMAE